MKNILLIILIGFSFNLALASKALDALPESTMRDLEIFSKKKLTNKDLPELKKNLNTLLILDDEDPARTAVIILSESYNKNKALYDKALKSIEDKKNKTKLKEIKNILKSHYTEGNG